MRRVLIDPESASIYVTSSGRGVLLYLHYYFGGTCVLSLLSGTGCYKLVMCTASAPLGYMINTLDAASLASFLVFFLTPFMDLRGRPLVFFV